MRKPATVNNPHEATPLWPDVTMPKWQPNRTAWLLTFVDLTSLLVGFFVLLFSTQTLKQDKWKEMTGSFQAQFAPTATVVATVPDGGDNAVIKVTGGRSGLAYLDTLLHQRLQGDAVWDAMRAEADDGTRTLRYRVPDAVLDGASPAASAAWARLGGAVFNWKNSVGIRVTASSANVNEGADKAVLLGGKLAANGAKGVFTEVVVGPAAETRFELVVRER